MQTRTRLRPPEARATGDPAAFFDAAEAAFHQAATAAGRLEYYFNIGGSVVRLSFAGPALVPNVTRSLAHLALEPQPAADLTVCVWESATTGVPAPLRTWPDTAFRTNGTVAGFDHPHIHTFFQLGTSALSLLHTRRRLAFFWVRRAEQLPYYEIASPLRLILYLWARTRGRLLVHGGAIGHASGGVLLVGKSGSGKSNTALAALRSPLSYAGDDYCLLAADPAPTAYSIFNAGKTYRADLHRLPFLAPHITNPDHLDGEKALFFIHEHFPDQIVTRFPLRAILMPRVTGQPTSQLRPTPMAAGLTALAPSTVTQLPGIQAEDFRLLVRAVRQVPSYVLEVGRDPAGALDLVQALLLELSAAARPGPGRA